MENKAIPEVSATSLAVIFGVTVRRIQQLAQDGVFQPVRRGKYSLPDAVQRYIKYKVDDVSQKSNSEIERERDEAEVRIKRAKAIVAEHEAQELSGNMHRSEDVAALTEDLIYTIRGMMMALPGRLAIDAAALGDPNDVSALIREEVFNIMKQLAQYEYDPQKYAARVRERRKWSPNDDGNSDDGE